MQCANNTQKTKAFTLIALEPTLPYTVFVQLPTEIKFRPKAVVVPATDAPRYMGIYLDHKHTHINHIHIEREIERESKTG